MVGMRELEQDYADMKSELRSLEQTEEAWLFQDVYIMYIKGLWVSEIMRLFGNSSRSGLRKDALSQIQNFPEVD